MYDSIDIQGSKKIICINNQDFQQYSKYFKVLAEDLSRYRIEKHKESLFYYQIQLQPIGQSKPLKKVSKPSIVSCYCHYCLQD